MVCGTRLLASPSITRLNQKSTTQKTLTNRMSTKSNSWVTFYISSKLVGTVLDAYLVIFASRMIPNFPLSSFPRSVASSGMEQRLWKLPNLLNIALVS